MCTLGRRDALKPPRIRRAASTLVYAALLHPAQRHLPVNLHPPNSAVLGADWLAGACRRRPCWSKMNVKVMTHEAALLGPQGHDHPLGCHHLHLLGDAPQRHRGPHLGASSSVWQSSRRGLACSSGLHLQRADESFCTCLEHTWNLMMLCSLMRMARLVTLQPVRSGRAFFGACVCCRVSTRVVQTCAVTSHRSFTTYPTCQHSLEERVTRVRAWSDQLTKGILRAKKASREHTVSSSRALKHTLAHSLK